MDCMHVLEPPKALRSQGLVWEYAGASLCRIVMAHDVLGGLCVTAKRTSVGCVMKQSDKRNAI
jgi:hypothetical protein